MVLAKSKNYCKFILLSASSDLEKSNLPSLEKVADARHLVNMSITEARRITLRSLLLRSSPNVNQSDDEILECDPGCVNVLISLPGKSGHTVQHDAPLPSHGHEI